LVAPATRERHRLPRDERRSQLLVAAARVFVGRDPSEVTFEEIADAAGVSRALVYNYFADRNSILEAVHREFVERLRTRVQEHLRDAQGEEALSRAVRAHVEFAGEQPDGYRYAAGRVPFAGLTRAMETRRRELASVYGSGGHAELMAVGTFAVIETLVLHWLDQGEPERGEITADELTSFISTLLMDGLRGVVLAGFPLTPHYPAE